MNKALPIFFCLLPWLGALGAAQEKIAVEKKAEAPAAEAPTNRPPRAAPLISPEVHPDRTVTFRLRATRAQEVTVSGEFGGDKPMTRDDQGVWSLTIGPLRPELYGYSFSVDGLRIADPSNARVKPMRSPTTSILDIPGDPPLHHDFTDVPHGTVRVHDYYSRALQTRRRLHVYTPPGYESSRRSYPTLYLFHGSGDNDATWTVLGRAHLIMDNLLSERKVREMVIVMTDGHAVVQASSGAFTNVMTRNLEAFERDLLEDVMPLIESHYRVARAPGSRAIVGLSMGGGQSLTIGLNHPELFSWVGGFSSYIPNPETAVASALNDPKATNHKLRLLWFACGKDDRLVEQARSFSEVLDRRGIKHQFVTTEGNHSWPVWRRYLADFAPLLFAR